MAAEPVYSKFTITSKIQECLQTPADLNKDPCKVQVEDGTFGSVFTLNRRGGNFFVDPSDANKVAKSFPSYSAPTRELVDYLTIKSEFTALFGTADSPTEIAQRISVVTGDDSLKKAQLFNTLDLLTNFVSHGRLNSKENKMRDQLESSIRAAIYTFADPTLGTLVIKKLRELQVSPKIDGESKKRIEWLLGLYDVREKLWGAMKNEFDQSTGLGNSLKSTSVDITTFLFANYVLAEKGYKDKIYSNTVKETSRTFHEVMRNVNAAYNPGENFYAYMVGVLNKLKGSSISSTYKSDFDQRLNFLISEYDKTGKEEMLNLLGQEPAETAFRHYFAFQYGETPKRREAVNIILKNTKVNGDAEKDKPSFAIDMTKTSSELQSWVNAQATGVEKKEALQETLFLLKALFEKNGKMKIYWGRQIQEVDNFYTTANFPVVGANKSALETLIFWARTEANTVQLSLPPDESPHTPIRKYTLLTELGVVGVATGGYFAFGQLKNTDTRYYSQGGSVILGASALGSAGGNLLSYAVDANKKNVIWYDLGGALVGGVIGGLIYGFAVKPTPPGPGPMGGPPIITNPNPGTRNPVDPYGP